MDKQTVVTATEGHREFGKLLRRVYESHEHLVVERDGFPVAVLMSYHEYQALLGNQSRANLEQLNRTLSKVAEEENITEETLLRDVKVNRRQVNSELYGDLNNGRV